MFVKLIIHLSLYLSRWIPSIDFVGISKRTHKPHFLFYIFSASKKIIVLYFGKSIHLGTIYVDSSRRVNGSIYRYFFSNIIAEPGNTLLCSILSTAQAVLNKVLNIWGQKNRFDVSLLVSFSPQLHFCSYSSKVKFVNPPVL